LIIIDFSLPDTVEIERLKKQSSAQCRLDSLGGAVSPFVFQPGKWSAFCLAQTVDDDPPAMSAI
jgi:hypothetical protein